MNKETTYRINGLTCTDCALKFENNVKKIEGVTDAKVNFGASKITVSGMVDISNIKKAGRFDNLQIIPENESFNDSKNKRSNTKFSFQHWKLAISILLVIGAYYSLYRLGEDNVLTVVLFISSILIGGYSLFIEGFRDLLKLNFTMQTLMTIAIIGASLIGEWSEGAIVVILFAVSEALERFSMDKARHSITSLIDIAPKHANVVRGNSTEKVNVEDIEIDDILVIKPGEKLPMDGTVIKGLSTINQSAITGESIPVQKAFGDNVYAGSINEVGSLEIKVTRLVNDTTIARIVHLVEEAQAEKAPAQAFVDKFAKFYTPSIILISLLIIIIPPIFFGGDWNQWLYQGLSVLVVGCPCSLVISTPVAIVTAIGNAAKNGVLIKGGVYLEEMGQIKAIAFDKTGTLTVGTPKVTDFIQINSNVIFRDDRNISIISALEKLSQHPLASSILDYANDNDIDYSAIIVEQFSSTTGRGIQGVVDGVTYFVSSPKMYEELLPNEFDEKLLGIISKLQSQGKTVMVFGSENSILSVIAAADEVRESSRNVISSLHSLGIEKTIMLSGDNQTAALSIGSLVGVDVIQGDLLPHDKLAYINQFKKTHKKVAMIGDGINDTPALASATVGIAMGAAGTDTAIETADIALMSDDLLKLPFLIKLSRKTLKIIKQNITFSILIKAIALLLIIPGWLSLWLAIIADMGATLIVTFNGLRLLKVNDKN